MKNSMVIKTRTDGVIKLIPEIIKKITDVLFLAPTLKDPRIGVCMTCNPMKRVFINKLVDLENAESCFILNHEIESLGGVNEMEFQKINVDIEYQEWKAGRIEL